jgi:purine-binding chemotaxis protein CheW
MSDAPRRPAPVFSLWSPQERAFATPSGPQELALLVFVVGARRLAIELHRTKEILRARKVTRLPRTPDYVEGIVSVRGKAMPVIDVGRRLGLGRNNDPDARFVIVQVFGNEPAALRVDRIVGVVRLRPELVAEPAAPIPWVRAIALDTEETHVLDLDALLERPLAR